MNRSRTTAVIGPVLGIVTFALGYLVTWVLAGRQATQLNVTGPLGGAVADWKAVAWVFFDSHFVGTRTPTVVSPGGRSGGEVFDTVALLDVTYLYVVPPLLLLAGGIAVARRTSAADGREGLLGGATMAVGYVTLAILLMLVSGETGVGPSPVRAVLIAGVVYPVFFGSLGGAVAGTLAGRTAERGSETPIQ